MFVPGFKTLRQVVSEKSLKENFVGKKKNGQIKGLISNMCFFITQCNSLLSRFVPNFRILSQVCAEKSLTEKKIQTNRVTEKAKTIYYPLYTS